MDDEQTLRQLMTAAADQAGPVIEAPPASSFIRRQRTRRSTFSVAIALCAVVAVVVSVSLVAATYAHRPSDTASALGPAAGAVTAASLATYRWTVLPAAPFAARGGSVAMWTGQQMIIWGGNSSRLNVELHADGAAYDPATKTWTRLPASPLTARASAASVWTGTSVFVWGGYVGDEVTAVSDGAMYTPADKTWTTLPAAPITAYGQVRAFWTGTVVVLLSTPTSAGTATEVVNAQTYNPATRMWGTLPNLRLPSGHPADVTADVAAMDRIYLWSMWSDATTTGVDSYTLDVTSRRWESNSLELPGNASSQALWTGRDVILPATSAALGKQTSEPAPATLAGIMLNPATASLRTIIHGPLDDLNPDYVWTGGALVAFNISTESEDEKGHHYPGEAAAWDPATNHWTQLAAAPLYGEAPATVWTGTSLLIWGQLVPSHGGSTESGTGLQFGP